MIGGVLRRGIAAGEFRPVAIDAAVHSLVLPMVMLCLHKHSLGACGSVGPQMDPHRFLSTHVDVVMRGQQLPQAFARGLLVVDQQRANHSALTTSTVTSS